MKILLSSFLLLVITFSALGQEIPCELSLKDAPALRSLKLGMTVPDVAKILGVTIILKPEETELSLSDLEKKSPELFRSVKSSDKTAALDAGVKSFTYNVPEMGVNANLLGVYRVKLKFYNESLFYIDLDYRKGNFQWKNIDEFVSNVSEKLNLNKRSWHSLSDISFFYCKDFALIASINDVLKTYSSSLKLENRLIAKEVQNKAEEMFWDLHNIKNQNVEKEKKEFKP